MAETYRRCALAGRLGEEIGECDAQLLLNTMVENGLTLRQIVPIMQHFQHCCAGIARCVWHGAFLLSDE
jgi:hypothetical protein